MYKWTHLPTGKWYIGSRTAKGCNPKDGYICSSKVVKPMILEKREEWKRSIVAIGDVHYIIDLESAYLKVLDAKHNKMSFNMHHGDGKFTVAGKKVGPQSSKHKAKLGSAKKGRIAWNKGLTKETDERVKHYSETNSKVKTGKPGHKHTVATKIKISVTEKLTKSKVL